MFSAFVLATVLAHAGPMDNVPGNPGNTGNTAKVETKVCKDGADLVLDARGSVFTVTGECGKVTIKGTGNAVQIESLKMLVAMGEGHAIKYLKNASEKPVLPTDLKKCTGCAVDQVKSF